MKILFVSTSDIIGGAARAANRLHRGLRNIEIDSHMLVLGKSSDDSSVQQVPGTLGKVMPKLTYRLDQLPLRRYPQRDRQLTWSLNWVPYPVGSILNRLSADLIHLHWIGGGFIPNSALGQVKKPVVWTLHDEWAFTGGCHYAYDCTGFTACCGTCPQLRSSREADTSRWIWQQKNRHWRELDLTIVTPSQWLAERAQTSTLFAGRRIEVIPNGINTRQYKPIDRAIARDILGLPQRKRLILFGAMSSTSDKRKGFHLLQPALEQIAANDASNTELVVIGASEAPVGTSVGLRAHYLGSLQDDVSLALVYSAADVFVAPSLQENLPNTIMEALACGTPCVAFRIGGIPDLIEHQRNGYLATPYEADDLARGIEWVLSDDERLVGFARRARQKVEAEFDINIIARRHEALYQELLSTSMM